MKTYKERNNLEEIDSLIHERIYSTPLHAVTDEDIARAVSSAMRSNEPAFKEGKPSKQLYIWNGNNHEVEYEGSKYNYGGNTGNDGYGLWFWYNRLHKSYQHDIETHVKNWKRPVPKYSSDFSLAMSAAEKVSLFDTIILAKDQENWITFEASVSGWNETKFHKFYSSGFDIKVKAFSSGFTAAEAVARACLVLKAKENEQSSRSDQ